MQLAQKLVLPGNPTGTLNPGTSAPGVVIGGPDTFRFDNLGDLIGTLIPLLIAIAGLMLFLYLIWGGFDYLFSAGDSGKMDAGRQKITNAVLGFIIIFISYFLTQLICFVFGCTLF